MNYRNFNIAIVVGDGLRHIDVVAINIDAAHADIREMYGNDVDIVSTTQVSA